MANILFCFVKLFLTLFVSFTAIWRPCAIRCATWHGSSSSWYATTGNAWYATTRNGPSWDDAARHGDGNGSTRHEATNGYATTGHEATGSVDQRTQMATSGKL